MGNYTFEHLNSINLKHYSQTCSNNHLCKTTYAESAQANLHPIVTLYKTNTCLTQPVTTFLTLKTKKTCLKQQLQNFILQRNVKKT